MPAGLAQRAVDVHRLRDRGDAVLRQHDHARAGALRRLDQLAAYLIDLRPRPARCADGRARAAAGCSRGAAGTPASTSAAAARTRRSAQRPIQRRRDDVRRRPPEAEQRELAERAAAARRAARPGAVWMSGSLRPSAGIHRPRRDRDVRARVHVVPPEQLGAGEGGIAPLRRVPQLFAAAPGGSTDATARPRTGRGNTSRWPTMPWSRGSAPVTKVDCTVVVTAGVTVSSGRIPPRFASAPDSAHARAMRASARRR